PVILKYECSVSSRLSDKEEVIEHLTIFPRSEGFGRAYLPAIGTQLMKCEPSAVIFNRFRPGFLPYKVCDKTAPAAALLFSAYAWPDRTSMHLFSRPALPAHQHAQRAVLAQCRPVQ